MEIIPLKREGLDISVDSMFVEQRDDLIATGSLYAVIETREQSERASQVIMQLAAMRRGVERAREEIKKPFIKAGREIDEKARAAADPILREEVRLARLCGDFAALEKKKREAAEKLQREELEAREREKAKQLAEATTIEQVDEIREKFAEEAALQPTLVHVPPVSKGTVVKEEWEFDVVDIHALYRAHPNLVTLEPIRGAIKRLLSEGVKIAGINARQVTNVKATGRTS